MLSQTKQDWSEMYRSTADGRGGAELLPPRTTTILCTVLVGWLVWLDLPGSFDPLEVEWAKSHSSGNVLLPRYWSSSSSNEE
jgi:hypothetical protein